MTDLILTRTHLRFGHVRLPCTVGRGGIRGDKRESDGATPVGSHRIVGLLYRPDRLTAPRPWARPIGICDLWSDDSGDAQYNQLVRAPYLPSHEKLRRADPLYDIVLLTDWNWPDATPGCGSAIFLHSQRRPGYPTEGCIAFRRDHLLWLVSRIELGHRLIVPRGLAT
ncbi:L,D-transpeptidase family protein [Cognatishimia sp. SS12]|uniref:L,D-transpeptidase family protein n=1 Tax=Cognatishimia sp. SS12 TaxID=2979465 RepID=UPI002330C680|nr:L,D-transpeptidase family protein [Cognatishimia sp. SS12]MDC0737922.1 L,D-transpeptidase family protein [Cognatishimia sp. SS12]